MKLKLGSIDDDIEALVVPELKSEKIIGLRSLKQFQCSLDFHCDNLWTGPQEGSIVPLHYEPLTISSSQPEATQGVDDPQGLLSSPEPPDTNSAATGASGNPAKPRQTQRRAVTNTMKTTTFVRLARLGRLIYKCKRGVTWTRSSRRFWS